MRTRRAFFWGRAAVATSKALGGKMVTYLGKLGELTLKGSNKKSFEQLLVRNITGAIRADPLVVDAKASLKGGRLYVTCDEQDCSHIEDTLSHLVGITGWARTATCEKSVDAIKCSCVAFLKEYIATNGSATFKVECRREDKSFPLNSYQIECAVGDAVCSSLSFKVDVHNPSVVLNIEVRDKVYLYVETFNGTRGLPVGCSGKALVLLSGGLDSPVAAYRLLRRGMNVDALYFHSSPYTSPQAQTKVETLAAIVSKFAPRLYLNIVNFTDVQLRIKDGAPEDWTTLMLRVCMARCANLVAQSCHADAIATGESLGQVASQTINNLAVTESFAELPLLRPLVALDKEEIIKDAKLIGTYDTSILPYEDCCVVFTPKHPVLHGTVQKANELYQEFCDRFDMDALIKVAYERRVVKKYEWGQYVSTYDNGQLDQNGETQ